MITTNRVSIFGLALATISIGRATVIVSGDAINVGWANTISGSGSSAVIGQESSAADDSMAVGLGVSATGYSFAVGIATTSSYCSFVAGRDNTASLDSAYIVMGGRDNEVAGDAQNSTLLGHGNFLAYQSASFAAGENNHMIFPSNVDGSGNVLLGEYNEINATGLAASSLVRSTVLIGFGNKSSETNAYAIGKGNVAQQNTITLGNYASQVSAAALIVGNGTSDTNRSNALVVSQSGSVTIPSGNLVLGGQSALTSTSAQSVIGSYLTAGNYLKKVSGVGASAASDAYFAFGGSSNASGTESLAIGYAANSTAYASIALGNWSSSNGMYGVALGGGTAEGDYSFSVGDGDALGDYSNAIGTETSAMGFASTAIGVTCSAWGDYSVALGSSSASGNSSVAIGYSTASGNYSYALGYQSSALSEYSMVLGCYAATDKAYSVALGSKNLSAGGQLTPQDQTTWRENEALFELGNGNPTATSAEYSNAITTLKNGQTTLTNKAWKQDPNVTATTSNAGGKALVVEGHAEIKGKTILDGQVVIAVPQGDISMGIYGN